MEPSVINDPPSSTLTLEAANEIQSLRSLLQLSVVAMLITTTALAVYLGWQYRQLTRELSSRVATMQEMPAAQERLNAIAEKFRQFGHTYPEFAEIVKKYGINPYDNSPTNTAQR